MGTHSEADPLDVDLQRDIFSDEELTELALAADPDAPLDADALPLEGAWGAEGPLPLWYMPATTVRARGGARAVIVAVIIVSLLVIVASGFCVTYGVLEIA